jgi:hypothetical protein
MNEIIEYGAVVEIYSQGENRSVRNKSRPRTTNLTLRGLILSQIPFCVFEFLKVQADIQSSLIVSKYFRKTEDEIKKKNYNACSFGEL